MWAILLLLSALPREQVIRNQFDVVEINHFYDQSGSLVFDQVIWWTWDRTEGRYQVGAWRILQDVRERPKEVAKAPDGWIPPAPYRGGHAAPLRRWDREGAWISNWYDAKDRCYREVVATHFRETRTQWDPEAEDRKLLPDDKRRGLTKPTKPTK